MNDIGSICEPRWDLDDTVAAFLAFWVQRVQGWRLKYASIEAAKKAWDAALKQNPDCVSMPTEELVGAAAFGQDGFGAGSSRPEIWFGDEGHRSRLVWVPRIRGPNGEKRIHVFGVRPCHPSCAHFMFPDDEDVERMSVPITEDPAYDHLWG